jgi:hypothetical protein
MTIRSSRHATTDVLLYLGLLENQFRVQFTKTDHRPASNLKQAVCFA